MSRKHPVVAITGSSGAGTSTVTDTFAQIFAREGINAAIVHGDSFHRYDRAGMKQAYAEAAAVREGRVQPLRSRRQPLRGARGAVPRVRRDGHRQGAQLRPRRRGGRRVYGQAPGTFTPWEDLPEGTDLLVLRGPARRRANRHGGRRPARRPADRRGADHQPGVDPEAAPRPHQARLHHRGRHRHDPAPDARLRALHLPAVLQHPHQLPAGAGRGHLQPVHRPVDPDRGRVDGRDPVRRPARHRLPLPAVDDRRLVHVAGRTASSCPAARWTWPCS